MVAWYALVPASRRKPQRPEQSFLLYMCPHSACSCFGRAVSYYALFSRGLMMYYSKPLLTFWGRWGSPSLTVNDLEREAKGKVTLVCCSLWGRWAVFGSLELLWRSWCSLGLRDPHWWHPVVRMGLVPQGADSGMLSRPGAMLLFKQTS